MRISAITDRVYSRKKGYSPGHSTEAVEAMTGDTANPEAIFAEAWQLHQQGELQAAAEMYRRVVAVERGHAEAWHRLGLTQFQLGRPAEARELIQQAIALNPHEPTFHLNLANIYRASGSSAEAEACYRHLQSLRPDLMEPYLHLAALYKELGQIAAAIAVLRKAVRSIPRSAVIQRKLGELLFECGELVEAETHLRHAQRLDPRAERVPDLAHPRWIHSDPRLEVIEELLATERPGNAETLCRSVQASDPTCARAAALLAVALERQERHGEAIDYHRQAAALAVRFIPYQKFLARALFAAGQFAEMVETCRTIAGEKPNDLGAHTCSAQHTRGWASSTRR